jgi:glycerophosphoryl diester phosphodiesterase
VNRGDLCIILRHSERKNTITSFTSSFTNAIELGADAFETNACVTRDGRFVLWRDRRRELAALGVDGISTDDAKLLRTIVGARAKTV